MRNLLGTDLHFIGVWALTSLLANPHSAAALQVTFEVAGLILLSLVVVGGGRFREWTTRHFPQTQVPPAGVVLLVRVIAFPVVIGLAVGLLSRSFSALFSG
jgi:hypothetical protein